MKRIITRGDDAGSSKSANRAIRDAAENGVLRNIGLMATCPAIHNAAEVFDGLKGVCFGVHGTLTSEWIEPRWGPVLPRESVPSLLDKDGNLFRNLQMLHHPGLNYDEVMAELQAQTDLLRQLGFELGYLDEHMGFAWPEPLAERVAAFAEKEHLVFRPAVDRLPKPPTAESRDRFDYAGRFLESLNLVESGTYLIVGHPCFDDEETRAIRDDRNPPGFHGSDRDGQRRLFTDPAVVARFEKPDIQAIRYTDI